jgi:hypothetical protein
MVATVEVTVDPYVEVCGLVVALHLAEGWFAGCAFGWTEEELS